MNVTYRDARTPKITVSAHKCSEKEINSTETHWLAINEHEQYEHTIRLSHACHGLAS